jgi:hypothetical protein
MDPNAVEQAKRRWERAEKAMQDLRDAKEFEAAENAWIDFLHAAGTIYTKLEQGAKISGKSQGWFGLKKKERKDDLVLRYLHFARNSDEHGIERLVTEFAGSALGVKELGQKLAFNEKAHVRVKRVDPITNQPDGLETDGIIEGPCMRLVRATDKRFNDYCDPPENCDGTVIYCSPNILGACALPRLQKIISEARGLIDPAPKP